jgi:hypothetical protein
MKGMYAAGVAFAAAVWLAPLAGVQAKDAVRIDASSDARVERSLERMKNQLAPAERQQLDAAIAQLNQVAIYSDVDAIDTPSDESPSATRIKGQIAGMTAREIIDLANRTTSTKAELLLQ